MLFAVLYTLYKECGWRFLEGKFLIGEFL